MFRTQESPGPVPGLWEGSPCAPLQGRDGAQRCCGEPDLLNQILAAVL